MSKIEKTPIKLTRAEKQSIASAVQRASNRPKGAKSAQDSIPYRHIFPDGICHVGDMLYTKTLQFGDINYESYNEVSLVRLRQYGAYESPATVSNICNAMKKRIDGFENFHFHLFRHTYTSKLLANGAAAKDVQ